MARRRINTKFIGISCAVLVVGAGSVFVARKYFFHENPQPYIDQGEMYLKNGQWDKAAGYLLHASALRPNDAPLAVKTGIAVSHLAVDDPEKMRLAVNEWRHAAEVDPNNKEAWQNLLDVYLTDLQHLEAQARNERTHDVLTQYFTLIRETATQLIRLDPKDLRNRSVIPELNIRLWLMDISLPMTDTETTQPYDKRPSDDQKINAAVIELTELLHSDAGNAQAAWWIGRAKLHQAQLLFQKDQTTDGYTLITEASRVFEDPILLNPPNVLDLYIGQVQLLSVMLQVDPRADMRTAYAKRLHESLDKAQALADPKDPQKYMAVKIAWAQDVARSDPGRAEQIYKEIIAANPSDITPKVELALMLEKDVTRRGDALAILDQVPDSPPLTLSESRRQEMANRILQVKLLRADILTNQMGSAQDVKEKDRLANQVQKLIDGLTDSNGVEKWRLLKAQGKLQLQRGQFRNAIQTLTSANDILTSQTGQKDSDLMLLLAEAERRGEQTGNAIAMLNEAMKDPHVASNPAHRRELAQLYLQDFNREKAKPHIDWLAVRFPDSPEVMRLQILDLDPVLDRDAIRALYKKLPEKTHDDVVQKIQMAKQLHDPAEIERLLQTLHQTAPDDVQITYQLGMVLLVDNHREQAKQLVAEALKLKPNDPTLMILSDAANGDSDKDLSKAVRNQVENISDPFARENKLADLARLQGHSDEELAHLQAALKIQPSSDVVLERLFLWYIAANQFDKAQEYVTKLSAIDADQAHGLLYQFKLAMAKGDIPTALAIGRQLTVDFKEFSQSWQSLGEALAASGQLDAASTKFVEALDKQPTNVKALQMLISCSYRLGKLNDAKRYIADARQKFPDDPNYKKMEVEHELNYGDPETVLDTLRADLKNSPDNSQGYHDASAALIRAAALKYANGDSATAKAHLAEARQILEKAVGKWPDNMRLVTELANACARAGDVPAGEAAIKAIAQQPRWKDAAGASVALADFYVQNNQPALAEAPLRAALLKTDDLPEIQLNLAHVLIDQGKFEPALAVLEKHQDLIQIRKLRTEALLNLHRGDQAESELLQAIKANPKDRQLNKLLLYVYYGQGKYDQVRKLATETIIADSTNLPAYYYRAMSNMRGQKPDLDSATNDLTFVRDQTADDFDARIALADVKVQKGDLNSAISELENALRAFPESKPARLKLLELYEVADPPRWIDARQLVTSTLAMPQFKTDVELLRAAAITYARHGDGDKALTNIRAAMAAAPDKSPLIHDYLTVLLLAKNYPLLLQETDPIVAAPNAAWWVYVYRGKAKALSGDMPGSMKEFDTALNLAGTDKTNALVTAVTHEATLILGIDRTLTLIAPRAQNSTSWKLVAIPLLDRKGDHDGAIKMAESALASADSLPGAEQDVLTNLAASLYLTRNPPNVPKATELYKKIIQRHPDDYVSMNNLACILVDANPPDTQQALVYANKAFAAVKATGHIQPMIYDTEGWVLILDGQVDEGINVLHQAIDQSDFPDAHYHLAEGYLRKQLPEDAQRELAFANDLIGKANTEKRHVDAELPTKIDAAQKRAKKMLEDKTQAAAP